MSSEEGLRRLYDRLDGPGGMVERVSEAEHKIDKHEAVCAERYEGINGRLKWLQYLMLALLIATLFEPRVLVQALMKQWGVEVSVPASPRASGG
jgi:hypothetical protein